MLTKVICGFPGIGKSYFKNNTNKHVLDSDSSLFSWSAPNVRNPNFPKNYIEHIKNNVGKVEIILVSSHKIVRDALLANHISFTIVYPEKSLKQEYLKRFVNRKSPKEFVELLSNNWNNWINEIENIPEYTNDTKCSKVILSKGEYLDDYLAKVEVDDILNEKIKNKNKK